MADKQISDKYIVDNQVGRIPFKSKIETNEALRKRIFERASIEVLLADHRLSNSFKERLKKSTSPTYADIDMTNKEFAAFVGMNFGVTGKWFSKALRNIPARCVGGIWLVNLGDVLLYKAGYEFEEDDFLYFNAAHLRKKGPRKRKGTFDSENNPSSKKKRKRQKPPTPDDDGAA